MNEHPERDNHTEVGDRDGQINLTSTKDEIEKLALGLADSYVEYFVIDTNQQRQKAEDSIEECLTHLEELSSVLDNYRLNSSDITSILEQKFANENESLNKLYEQVDALEQYIFETNKLLDQLENSIKELELSKGSKEFKIIEMISRFSLNNLPRFSFGNMGGILEETGTANSAQRNCDTENSIVPINQILATVQEIQTSLDTVTSNLNARLLGENAVLTNPHKEETMLDCNLPEQVDGSWQELL